MSEEVVCPYCSKPAVFMPSSAPIYRGRDYGPVYACLDPCGAWVGCHKGTTKPLGRLANAELRQAKQDAHAAFDPVWKRKHLHRPEAYKRLAYLLGIPAAECHIGLFDVERCQRVVTLCRSGALQERIAS